MTIISTGIDTLEVGYWINQYYLQPEVFKHLDYIITTPDSDPTIEIKGQSFIAKKCPRHWKYTIHNDDIMLSFNPIINTEKNFQQIHVIFRSKFLWREQWFVAWSKVDNWLNTWANTVEHKVSRADLCVDTTLPLPTLSPQMKEIVTRSLIKRNYSQLSYQPFNSYSYGQDFTGFVFGKSPLMNRTYDKLKEIEISHKEWFKSLWYENGWNDPQPATRVEFQLRRDFLRETSPLRTDTIFNLAQNTPQIWHYLTEKWLTIRQPNPYNPQRSRWKLSPFWEEISQPKEFMTNDIVQRDRQTHPTYDMLLKQAGGCLSTTKALGYHNGLSDLTSYTATDEYKEKVNVKTAKYGTFN